MHARPAPAAESRFARGAGAAVLILPILAILLPGAVAQEPPRTARETEKIERERELEILRSNLEHTKKAEEKLKIEVEALRNDRKQLSQALVDTASRIRTTESGLSVAELRLAPMDAREGEITRSLETRRELLAEVLAALVRLGRRPPPTLLLRPEDALASVRTAILLGAIVPEVRTQAETLLTDLTELTRLRREIEAERATLQTRRAELEEDRRRLAALVAERQRSLAESEKALEAERTRTAALARQVENVAELIVRMEKEIELAARAAEAARRQSESRMSLAALSDPTRLSPALPFVEAKGRLPLPVAGTRLRAFGAPDGSGGAERGVSIAAGSGAPVVAPCDGWIVYAGPFRSYGRLLIINAGGGYHVLLAGMEQITVDVGQFVLTGEPVAVMGSGPRMASAAAGSASQPVLYVEFRKDGNSIDPGPWWAETESEKARG